MSETTVTTYTSSDEMFDDLRRSMEAADRNTKPWQEKLQCKQLVMSLAEGEPVFSVLKRRYSEQHLKCFAFVESFSIFVPEGEYGDLHLSTVIRPLSQEEFDAAREAGWRLNGGAP